MKRKADTTTPITPLPLLPPNELSQKNDAVKRENAKKQIKKEKAAHAYSAASQPGGGTGAAGATGRDEAVGVISSVGKRHSLTPELKYCLGIIRELFNKRHQVLLSHRALLWYGKQCKV